MACFSIPWKLIREKIKLSRVVGKNNSACSIRANENENRQLINSRCTVESSVPGTVSGSHLSLFLLQHRHVPHTAGLVLASLGKLEQPLSLRVTEFVAAGGVGVVRRELVKIELGTHPLAITASEGDVLIWKATHVMLNLQTNRCTG